MSFVVKPLAVYATTSSGRMSFFSSMRIPTTRDDEEPDPKSFSNAVDESDALEQDKQSPPLEKGHHNATATDERWSSLAKQIWRHFSTIRKDLFRGGGQWLLEQPRGDSFAPFYFGGRDPFVFHDTFIPVLLARQEQKPLPYELLDLPLGYDIQEKIQQHRLPDGSTVAASYYEMVLPIPKEVVDVEDLTVQLEATKDGTKSWVLHVMAECNQVANGKVTMRRTTKLDESLLIPPKYNVDTNHIHAKFLSEEGVLVLTLPQKSVPEKRDPALDKIKIIPITADRNAKDVSDDYLRQTAFSDAYDESDLAETGKRQHAA
jgi:hypothetical protein